MSNSWRTPAVRPDARRPLPIAEVRAGDCGRSPSSDLRTLHVVLQPVGPNDIAASKGHLVGTYGASDRNLVLICLDGYVARISDAGDVSAVLDYLPAIG